MAYLHFSLFHSFEVDPSLAPSFFSQKKPVESILLCVGGTPPDLHKIPY
jgi:hypothetical protein